MFWIELNHGVSWQAKQLDESKQLKALRGKKECFLCFVVFYFLVFALLGYAETA